MADRRAFVRHLSPVRKKRWVVYAKPPFAGPQAVLAYLSRYTHRVAISNRRLINFDRASVTFRYKDYRRDASDRQRVLEGADPATRLRAVIALLRRERAIVGRFGAADVAAHGVPLVAHDARRATPPRSQRRCAPFPVLGRAAVTRGG